MSENWKPLTFIKIEACYIYTKRTKFHRKSQDSGLSLKFEGETLTRFEVVGVEKLQRKKNLPQLNVC